jgi:hypothetical protein
MVPVFLLIVGIGILLILILILSLFFIPVIARVALGKTPQSGYFLMQASWGWIGARTRTEGGESRQELLLGDHPLFTRAEKAEEGRAPGVGEEPRRNAPPASRALHLLRLIRPLSRLGGKILHSMTLEEIRGRMKVGFQDPAQTGILFGWYCAILPALAGSRVSLEVTPVFDREVLEGEIMARVRIDRPLLLILATARLFLDRDVRVALSGLRRADP